MTAVEHRRSTAAPAGVLAPLLFTLRTKGAPGFAARVATVATRFGPTPRTMQRRLDRMVDMASTAGFRPTCPITATVLVRHPEGIRALADRGMEIAVHGLRHNDHRALDAGTQERELRQAVDVFARCGITPTGFRAPYLRADKGTRDAVRAAGLSWQSDDAVAFPTGTPLTATDDGYARAIEMYDAKDCATTACRPRLEDGLVQIPVCVPDDEMLVDRLRLGDAECALVWTSILEATRADGDLFTMQVHPERFVTSMVAVEAVLTRAAALGGVWSARLDEIAEWWRARAACTVDTGPLADGVHTYALRGDERARLRLVGGTAGGSSPSGPSGAPSGRAVTVAADVLPLVAIAPDVSPEVARFLAEDGFLVTSTPAGPCAVELAGEIDATDQQALRRRVLSAPHPVLAIDRWPDGARSALALTGDIDALTMQDFGHRIRENAHGAPDWITGGVA